MIKKYFNEELNSKIIYRYMKKKELETLLKNKIINKNISSFTLNKDEILNNMMFLKDDVIVSFDYDNMKKLNNFIEIEYTVDFFTEHPEISEYISGYKNAKEYYQDREIYTDDTTIEDWDEIANKQGINTWEGEIESFYLENEIIVKDNYKIDDNSIVKVEDLK